MADSNRLGLLPTAGGTIVAAVVLVAIVYFDRIANSRQYLNSSFPVDIM